MTTVAEFLELVDDGAFQTMSFGLLAAVVKEQVEELGLDNLDSDAAVVALQARLENWSDPQFAFLLSHSCYIPDHYPETGSEETLFSKLVECVVCEWGLRMGYEAQLQKEKSTKEDVTFFRENDVVVCDAKSNRLGRSQKSPNVKDVMKTSEYKTWLQHHADKEQVGGFATFPSLMEWARGSAIHTYLTDYSNPIMLIYNEHLAYMLLKKQKNPALLFETLKRYAEFFPAKLLDKAEAKQRYGEVLEGQLRTLADGNDFDDFMNAVSTVTGNFVSYSRQRLSSIIEGNLHDAKEEAESLSLAELRGAYAELKAESLNKNFERILNNIVRFRGND